MDYTIETIIQKILLSPTLYGEEETADQYVFKYTCKGFSTSFPNENELKSYIGDNDILIITILENNEISSTYNSISKEQIWKNFIDECKQISYSQGEELVLEAQIRKKITNNTLHVYNYSRFSENFKYKQICQFLEIWNARIDTALTVIVHDKSFKDWETSTISFQNIAFPHKFQPQFDKEQRASIRDKHHRLVYSDLNFDNILPNDLYIKNQNSNDEIQHFFCLVCFYYTLSFLFDFCTSSSNGFLFKLNGFKTKEYSISNNLIGDINYCPKEIETVFAIYNWIYSNGNCYDKMTIARNIISINLTDSSDIVFNKNTFSAIQSNFRYFSRDNAKNFISLRNEISKILLEQENKVASYVSEFISDFKKSILPSITFFISVIAIRAISHQEIFDGFSPSIMKISILLVILSIINLLYSWIFDFNKKIHFAQRQIKDIKDRYKPLLTEKELDEIFYEGDTNNNLNYFSFAKKQRCYTIILWIVYIFLLSACLFVIGVKP